MCSRIPRLWSPGDPRPRIFLPDFWIKLVETPKKGHQQLPKNAAAFEVDPRMSKLDVREYLEKIYKLPVREVRTMNVMGEITWDNPKDRIKRRALWKEEDKKVAFVFFRKDFVAEFPDLFEEMKDEEVEKAQQHKEFQAHNQNVLNKRFMNKERVGVGEDLPI